jgi:hypothetical protein
MQEDKIIEASDEEEKYRGERDGRKNSPNSHLPILVAIAGGSTTELGRSMEFP